MKKEEFEELLKAHDWYYMMSDDPRLFDAGLLEETRIKNLVEKYPKLKPLYQTYKEKNKV